MIIFFQVVLVLLLIATVLFYIAQQVKADIYIQPIIGLMFGALYSSQDLQEHDATEYTLQCCIGFISLTIIWADEKK
jgi:hypothetical protein